MDAQTIGVLFGVVGGVVMAAGVCMGILARIGAHWREAAEEWAPDEFTGIED